jgi:hypothetical protein
MGASRASAELCAPRSLCRRSGSPTSCRLCALEVHELECLDFAEAYVVAAWGSIASFDRSIRSRQERFSA